MNFSFVLPAYKGRYLRESINSILHQDYLDFELIVVDDCSPDPIKDIVSAFKDDRVIYYRNEQNIGGKNLVAQWNHCLTFAKGDYVILATDDDLYETNFLSSFVLLIKKYPAVDLFRARILQVDAHNGIKEIDRCYKEYLSPIEFRYHLMHGMKGGIPQYVFKRESLLKKGGFVNFPKAWAADDATALMMSEHGVVNSQEHMVRFRWSDINISSDRTCGEEKFKARLMFYQWLCLHPASFDGKSDWSDFYQKHVVDYLPIYNKIALIATMNSMTWMSWIKCTIVMHKSMLLSSKNKMSIILRSLQKRMEL